MLPEFMRPALWPTAALPLVPQLRQEERAELLELPAQRAPQVLPGEELGTWQQRLPPTALRFPSRSALETSDAAPNRRPLLLPWDHGQGQAGPAEQGAREEQQEQSAQGE
jgi:hypothetical protein